MDLLDDAAITDALAGLEGWRRDGDHLVRRFICRSFLEAIAFIGRIALLAEAADHHPELLNSYRDVEVRLSTHEVGGITLRDVTLARAIDGVVQVAA
jgi:4a-hydroxytetrahydrobiopterin dehydratase